MTTSTTSVLCCRTMNIKGCDETNPDVLGKKHDVLLRAIGDLPDGTHVAVDCSGVERFSAGVVEILIAMTLRLREKRARLGCINVSPEAADTLRNHPNGTQVRICYDTSNLAYGQE